MAICFPTGILADLKTILMFERNFIELEHQQENLSSVKNDVIEIARIRERRLEEEEWFHKVEAAESEVDELRTKISEQNWKSLVAVKYGKRVPRQLQVVTDLVEEGLYLHRRLAADDDPVNFRPVKSKILGRDSLFRQIWLSFTDPKVGIIGLTGTGGVGKTTLLKQIRDASRVSSHRFDAVIWVTMSKNVRLEKIQEKIGKSLGVSWEKGEEKASILRRYLRDMKFVLFLDDIQESIELHTVGVPLPEEYDAGSKIVFTTHSVSVCNQMGAHLQLEVGRLSREEAWEIFQSKVGEETLISHPDIHHLAKIVAGYCDGLPLASITAGQAMSSKKSLKEWYHVIDVLKRSAYKFPNLEKKVLHCLKLSYNSLLGKTTRFCLLYFSLFPKNYEISKRDLIDYWITEGVLKERWKGEGLLKERWNEGDSIIDILRHACLFKEEDDGDHVKLHSLVHDMALWIASEINKEAEQFVAITNAELVEVPETTNWERAKRVSVMGNKIEKMSWTPNCPDLLTLFLGDNHLRTISGGFFQSMPSLKVLNLSNNPYLTGLPIEMANLVSLEHLDLSRTGIQELLEDLKALAKLKCLNLENTSQLHTIPTRLISNFSMLEILRMLNCGSRQPTKGSLLCDDGILLIEELLCLDRLEMLSVNLTSFEALSKFLSSHDLQKSTQFLCLQFLHNLKSIEVSVEGLERLDTLHIVDCSELERLMMNRAKEIQQVPSYFYSLRVIVIESCFRLRDLSWLILVPSLKRVAVSNCPQIVEIISVPEAREFSQVDIDIEMLFCTLEHLELQLLPNLLSIHENALRFLKLREIKVDRCWKLRKLPLDDMSVRGGELVIWGQEFWWDQLRWEDQATENAFRRSFRRLHGSAIPDMFI